MSWSRRRTLIAFAIAATVPASWRPTPAHAQLAPSGERASLPALQRSGLRIAAPEPMLTRPRRAGRAVRPDGPVARHGLQQRAQRDQPQRHRTPPDAGAGQPQFAFFCTAQRIGARALITRRTA
jgi:hypothetical protein